MEFIQPLETLPSFDARTFHYLVLQQKYIELLCVKSEAGLAANVDSAVDEVVKVLSQLEKLCPSKEVYNHYCLLLTLPKLVDHPDYHDWNPSAARVRCFQSVYPLVEKFLPYESTSKDRHVPQEAANDRLIHLLIKGKRLFILENSELRTWDTSFGSLKRYLVDVSCSWVSGFDAPFSMHRRNG